MCLAIPPQWKPQNPEELQTHFSAMNGETQSRLARQHSAKKQFFHLLWKILLRWFATFVLSAGMLVTFYEFERVMILDKSQKRWFNALSTGLYLTLGLNLAVCFTSYFNWRSGHLRNDILKTSQDLIANFLELTVTFLDNTRVHSKGWQLSSDGSYYQGSLIH